MSKATVENTAVIIPIYNSVEYLETLFNRISTYIPRSHIIAVDDGSSDHSGHLCEQLGVKLISFPKNRGKGSALQAGFDEAIQAGFDYAFTIDSDLQHLPESIPRFFRKINAVSADLIIGKRDFSIKKMPFPRILSNQICSLFVSLLSAQRVYDSQCGYRLYKLEKIKKLKLKSTRYQYETEIILELSRYLGKIDYVCIDTIYDGEKSYISHVRDIKNFVKLMTKYL